MAGSNILVHLGDGAVDAGIPVLTVHVVVPRARVVAHPDTVGGDSRGLLLVHLHYTPQTTSYISIHGWNAFKWFVSNHLTYFLELEGEHGLMTSSL